MHFLYTENILNGLRRQIHRRFLFLLSLFIIFSLIFACILIFMDDHKLNRPELLSTLVLILFLSVLIFLYENMIRPLRDYARHVETSIHGRSHQVTVLFDHQNNEESKVDGVLFFDLIFLGEADKHGDRERLFYWDAEIPVPEFSPGQEVTLLYYDHFITAYQD